MSSAEQKRISAEIEVSPLQLRDIFPGIQQSSSVVYLDFSQFPENLPASQRIDTFFAKTLAMGRDPRSPEERQRFNTGLLQETGKQYLIGRYCENRIAMLEGSQIAREGRTFHLGIDIFTSGLEQLHAPYSGTVVRAGQEKGSHTYGYYVVLEHVVGKERVYCLYGHLSAQIPPIGMSVRAGQVFARLGDFTDNENGGWSRHVHVQLLRDLPNDDDIPIGYSTQKDLALNMTRFPNPNTLLRIPGIDELHRN